MRRMRKLWAVLLAVCMVCNLYGMDVFAAGNEQSVANGNKNGYTVYTEERAQEPEDAGVAGEAAGNGNSETVEDTGKAEDSDSADGATDSTESETEETDSGNTAEETEEDGSGNTAGDFEEGNSGNTGDETGDGDSADIPAGNETDNSGDIENGDSADENNSDAVEGDGERDDIDEPEEESAGVDEENIEEEKSLLMKKTVMMTSGVGEVSRAEWLAELTETFSMSVMEDNYPDNYFSDIDSSSEYYYVVMLATEFGLVDVEAGEPFRPDDPATREFTAHTLNFCLGFLPEQEANYTFSEASDVTYADDIQVAVERGWFSLENGNFHPETPVTLDEKTIMVEDAKSVLADRKAPTEHSNSYTFAEDVIDLTKANVRAEMTDDNELTFYECSENLSAGNKYGLEFDGFPSVFKAVDITQAEDGLVVQFENVPLDEAFTNIDMQGGIDVDLATVQAYSDDVELHYIVGGTEEKEWEDGTKYDTLEEVGSREISAVEAVRTYSVSPEKSHEINLAPGVKITVSCKVSDVKPDYDIKLFEGKAHVAVNAKVIFSCNVSADAMEAAGISPTLELVRIPIACVGYFGVKMDMTMSGEATLNLVGNVFLGLYYEYGGFRMEKGFTKESFTLQTRMEISATVTATLGMNACNIMQGELYAKFGAKDVLDSITYGDGQKPATCAHQNAWLFASAGGYAQVKLGSVKPWKKDYPIYNEKNSPVRVSFHYEDGVAVSKCARGTIYGPTGKRWGYYTPVDSKYGYNGVSKGTGANGEPYTIFEYSLDDANRATITSYKGNVSALSIPKTLDGYTVVGIGNSVFQNNKQLRVVVVPDSVTEIGYQAFYNCTNLSQVTLSKNVKTMGTRAFGNCTSLTAIEIPKSLTDSGGPFEDCSNLRNVTFEKGVTEITSRLFWHCNGIEEVTIPDTVTVIEYAAFYNCSKLSRVGIPNSVTEIGSEAFENCAKLTEVNIPDSVTEIEYQAFYNCTNLSQVTLSKNVKTMGTRAFGNCTSLTAIEIPKSLTDSGGPFEDCSNLRNVTFEKGVTEITNRLFCHCNGIEEVTIPDTVTVIEDYAFYNCSKLSRVEIPNSVTEIGSWAFQNCAKLTEVNIPDSVTEIEYQAFYNCTNLSQVTLSKNVKTMGTRAFGNCTSLTAIEIPKSLTDSGGPFEDCSNLRNVTFEKGVTEITNRLFCHCNGIEEVTIPDTVTVIEDYAFYNCSKLSRVEIPNSVTEIGSWAFQNCAKLTEVNIPDSVTEIEYQAFYGCTNLPKISIPNSVTSLGTRAFAYCTNLRDVSLSEKLTSIGTEMFRDCGLTAITIPPLVTEINSYAFQNCSALTEVNMPNSMHNIGSYAFYNCDALTKVVIPDSVTTMGTYIFADCELLSDVTLGTGITTIPSYAFNLCPSLQKIVLPYRTAAINSNAFTNCTSLTEITIPRATTTIASGVFSYPARLTVYGVAGTYAETYANNIGATFINQETRATEVKLSATDLKLTKGSKATLYLSVAPSNFTDEVTWKSTDTNIATIEDTGIVTAKAIGTATVKVTVGDISASCKITVTQPVTSISLNKTSLCLEAWDTEKLTASVSPSTAENKAVLWSTSDARIASVDDTGLVTAHTKGTATITVTAQDGSGVSRSCTVTVVNNGYLCSTVAELESPHNYPVNCSDFWLYTKEGAESLYITFDLKTEVEEGFDYLCLYDGKGAQIGKYTGTELAGQAVEVPGDTVRIKLVSDDSGTAWGFKVTYIMGTGDVENDECLVTFDSQGGTAISAVQVAKGTAVPEPAAPTRCGYEFMGWYLGDTLYDFTQPVTGNTVLRAKWKFIVTEPDLSETEQIPEEDKPEDGVIPEGLWIAGVKDQTYTGKALKPEVRVYDGSRRLQEKTDYTISYKNNVRANDASDGKKAPTITVKGKGNYSGSVTAVFKIVPVNIAEQEFAVAIADMVLAHNGKIQKKAPVVTFNGKKLSNKRDYTVTYPDTGTGAYQEAGSYPVQITGVGNFTGTRTVNLEITDKMLISKAKAAKIPNQLYSGGEDVTLSADTLILYRKTINDPLKEGVDYTVTYENNREIGTATAVITGTGNYAGTKRITFKIVGTSINKAVVEGIENKIYNGMEQQQDITVRVEGKVLTPDKDYTVSYSKNLNVGTASMTIQGTGAYSGTTKKTFKIMAYDLGVDEGGFITEWKDGQQVGMPADSADKAVKSGEGTGTSLTVEYTQGGSQPEVTLKFRETELIKGKDYTISYKNNKNLADQSVDKAPTMTIKGKGNFKGTRSEKFSIVKKNLANPESPVLMSVPDVAYANGAGKYISKPVLTDTNGKTLKAGTDYEVSYTSSDGFTKLDKKSTVQAGAFVCVTVRGKGKYEGSLMTTYRITQANFTKASVRIAPQIYTGSNIYLTGGTNGDILVKAGKMELTYGVDYEIMEDSYVNNIKKGTASVKIRGINNYGGTRTVKFKIQAKKIESFSSIVRAVLFGTE